MSHNSVLQLSKSNVGNSPDLSIRQDVVFIDQNVDDYQFLSDNVIPGVDVIVLHPDQDGIAQISLWLAENPSVNTIHILSHGAPGSLNLGSSQLSLTTLHHYTEAVQNWGAKQLVIYGCNVASGDAGIEFLEKLRQLTGASILASATRIGNAKLGGNWNLEVQIGEIANREPIFNSQITQTYQGVFADLINGLGGGAGFGEGQVTDIDDTYDQVDISAVFQDGFNFFGTTYSAQNQFFIGTNGYITFGSGLSSFSPAGIAGSTIPMIAVHYTDIHPGTSPIAASPGGTSTGSNNIYYDIDTVNDVVTITYDDVRDFAQEATIPNAYQIRLFDLGNGDFTIELRYENLSWGGSGSAYGTAGWSAGDQANYAEVPGSGTSDIENIESQSNIGEPGVFQWEVRGGSVIVEPEITPSDDWIEATGEDDDISSMAGNDVVFGLDGNDRLNGEEGHDRLEGGNGNDTLLGWSGRDTLNGGLGGDRLEGNGGQDYLNGGDADDNLDGGFHNDTLLGGDGGDRLEGNRDNDRLVGGSGNDTLLGGKGQDTLLGGIGKDNLLGQQGDDRLDGGDGNDTINGGLGNDVIITGDGSDRIMIQRRHGFDQVRDFTDGLDRIILGSNLRFEQLSIQQRQDNVLISYGTERLLMLENMQVGQISQTDFA